MAAFLDVILRGLALSGQAIAVGGVVFALLVLGPAVPSGALPKVWRRLWTLVALGASGVAIAQAASLGILVAALGGEATWSLRELAATIYVQASLVRILAAAGLAVAAVAARDRGRLGGWWGLLLGTALIVGVSGAWTSHSAARLEHRGVLMALDALHQLAAAAWIGGLVHLVATAFSRRDEPRPVALLRRYAPEKLIEEERYGLLLSSV